MHVTPAWWLGTVTRIAVLMAVDLTVSGRHRGTAVARSVRWVLFYCAVAIGFGVALTISFGGRYAGSSSPAG